MSNYNERAAALLTGETDRESTTGPRDQTHLLDRAERIVRLARLAVVAAVFAVGAHAPAAAQGVFDQVQRNGNPAYQGNQGYPSYQGNQGYPSYQGNPAYPQDPRFQQDRRFQSQQDRQDQRFQAEQFREEQELQRRQAQRGGSFVGNMLTGNFSNNSITDTDRQYMGQAEANAYNAPRGQRTYWQNPETGHSGTYVVTSEGRMGDGTICRQLDSNAQIGTRNHSSRATICQDRNTGAWRLVRSQDFSSITPTDPDFQVGEADAPAGPRLG